MEKATGAIQVGWWGFAVSSQYPRLPNQTEHNPTYVKHTRTYTGAQARGHRGPAQHGLPKHHCGAGPWGGRGGQHGPDDGDRPHQRGDRGDARTCLVFHTLGFVCLGGGGLLCD